MTKVKVAVLHGVALPSNMGLSPGQALAYSAGASVKNRKVSFIALPPRTYIIKFITAVIYGFPQ
jgi:hypothetical protein